MNLIWFATVGAFALMAASLWLLRVDAVPILVAGIPSLLALCGIDRWAARGSAP
jgi:hypothetical protein